MVSQCTIILHFSNNRTTLLCLKNIFISFYEPCLFMSLAHYSTELFVLFLLLISRSGFAKQIFGFPFDVEFISISFY